MKPVNLVEPCVSGNGSQAVQWDGEMIDKMSDYKHEMAPFLCLWAYRLWGVIVSVCVCEGEGGGR